MSRTNKQYLKVNQKVAEVLESPEATHYLATQIINQKPKWSDLRIQLGTSWAAPPTAANALRFGCASNFSLFHFLRYRP